MADKPSSFPFFKLPAELRRRVLLQTDLVTPLRKVEYNDGKLAAIHSPVVEDPRTPRLVRNNETGEVVRVYPAPQTSFYDDAWDPHWRPPAALFLVNKEFSALAQSVLLSENHFRTGDSMSQELSEYLMNNDDPAAWEDFALRDLATSQAAMFVSAAGRCEVLENLRSLDVYLPRLCVDGTTRSGAILQWQTALQRLGNTLKPRRLIIYMEDYRSIPIIETVFGTHPDDFRHDKLERHDIIDLVRQSVGIYWPLDRLARFDGVRMFLWHLRRDSAGDKLVYYCRHRSEELPRMAGDMDLFEPLPSPIFHTQRECQGRSGSEHDEQEAMQTNSWVEGIFARPMDEHDLWVEYENSMMRLPLVGS